MDEYESLSHTRWECQYHRQSIERRREGIARWRAMRSISEAMPAEDGLPMRMNP